MPGREATRKRAEAIAVIKARRDGFRELPQTMDAVIYVVDVDALLLLLEQAEQESKRLREALVEARPYVYNRVGNHKGTTDWRSETALDILGRVDAALASEPPQ